MAIVKEGCDEWKEGGRGKEKSVCRKKFICTTYDFIDESDFPSAKMSSVKRYLYPVAVLDM